MKEGREGREEGREGGRKEWKERGRDGWRVKRREGGIDICKPESGNTQRLTIQIIADQAVLKTAANTVVRMF